MFFTTTARIVAWFMFVLAILRIIMAGSIAIWIDDPMAARTYLATETTGEAINEACIWLFAALALGVGTEISRTVKRIGASEPE